MSWYSIELTAEQIAFGFADIIRAETAEAWLSRGVAGESLLIICFSRLGLPAAVSAIGVLPMC
jgi:hypothetical protein